MRRNQVFSSSTARARAISLPPYLAFHAHHIRVHAAVTAEFHEHCVGVALLENQDDLLDESRLTHESFPFGHFGLETHGIN